MRWFRFLPIVLAMLALSACDAEIPTAPGAAALQPEAPSAALSAVPGVQEVVGETGPGSTYALFRPEHWNGELVVYAHGYVQPFFEPTLPTEFDGVRDFLLTQGFAVAYSSWSETGYAVKDGAQRTHQVSGLFAEEFGTPGRTYLVGTSLGGLVADMLAERFSTQYDGTLALCGVMAGGMWNASYVADFRLLFDYFYPGVLPGTLYEVPEGVIVAPGAPLTDAIIGAIAANPGPAVQMAGMDQIRLQYVDVNELIVSFVQVLGYQVNGANALTERLHGHGFFDNIDVRYSGSADDDAVNAGIARYAADPSAVNYMGNWWDPTGGIAAPFITLHTTRDPLVPARVEQVFAGTVDDAGQSGLLLQRTVDAFGHCNFSGPQIIGAFLTLVQWVASGERPAA